MLLEHQYFLVAFQGPLHALAFSPNGKFLASGATDGRVLLWDIGHGLMIGELKGHTDTIYSLRFSRDGEILASGKCCRFLFILFFIKRLILIT